VSLWTSIRSIIARGLTEPIDPRRGQSYWIALPYIPDGLQLTVHQSFEVSTVWACCNLIANSIAAAPWYVLDVDRSGKRSKLVGDPLAYLLNVAPNRDMVAQSAKEALLWQALIHGDGYGEIVLDGAGRTAELWPLLTERMLPPGRDEKGALFYEYVNPNGRWARLGAASVFHLRGPSLDGLMGQGTVVTAMKSIATAAAQDRFTASYFANSATPSGVLTTTKPLKAAERDSLKLEFAQKYASHKRAGTPLVLDSGTTWTQLSADPDKAQLIQGRQFSIEDIARYFGVPLHLLASPQGSQGYGKNLSEIGHSLINFGLRPWTKRLEQEAQVKLVGPRSSKVTVIDLSDLSRGTEKEMAEADEIRIRSGVNTINECRAELGKNHGPPELDHHLVLTTLQPVEKALAPTPAPGATPGGAPPNGVDPEQDPGGDQIGTEPAARVNADLLAVALDAHARRFNARRRDLVRNGSADRMPGAVAELRAQIPERFRALCEAVEAGADPYKVAHHHLGVAL